MSVAIRPYAPEDFDTLYQIDQACYPPGIAYAKGTLRWFLRSPGADCLVAEEVGRILGFILAEQDAPQAHIITLDVLESHRRRGIGTALVGEAEQRLAGRGVRLVELETATNNEPAVAFWRKHGYRTVGVLKHYYLGRVDAYTMIKPLAPTKEN